MAIEDFHKALKKEIQNVKTQMSQSGNMKREIKTNINISLDKIQKIV
jgi:hypothetical protein